MRMTLTRVIGSLFLALVLALAGCGGGEEEPTATPEEVDEPTEEAEPTEDTEPTDEATDAEPTDEATDAEPTDEATDAETDGAAQAPDDEDKEGDKDEPDELAEQAGVGSELSPREPTPSEQFALDLPATDQGTLQLGEEGTSELNSLEEADDWTYEGSAGEAITIRAEATAGEETDPRVLLLSPGGELLASDDDGGVGFDALIPNVTLPEDGTYTIKVDVFNFGEYAISVNEGTTADEEEFASTSLDTTAMGLNPIDQGSISLGDQVTAELNSLADAHDWMYEGSAGEAITIRAVAPEGEGTDPRISVLAPDGELLTSNDDGGIGLNAFVPNYRLPADGTYTIRIDVFEGGNYNLSLTEGTSADQEEFDAIAQDELAMGLPSTEQGTIAIGEQVTAQLDSLLEVHDWLFEGTAGQVVTIRAEAAPGANTDPRLNLIAPDGLQLATDDDGGGGLNAAIEEVILPEDGTYIIKVDVFEGGEYILSLEEGAGSGGSSSGGSSSGDTGSGDTGSGGIEENSAMGLPSTAQGTITPGGSGTGQLDSLLEAHDWDFAGTAGQTVTISCEAAPGEDTDPRITLIAPDGTPIASDDDGGSGTNALIEGFTLPADGTYVIKVDIFSGGEYILSVE